MNNTTGIFTFSSMILDKFAPYIITIIVAIITFVLLWKHNNRMGDRHFLRTEIYTPLLEEIKQISASVSKFEICNLKDYNRRDRIPGNVRNSLIETGHYDLIPNRLRKNIDWYYDKCEEYNKKRNRAYDEITNIWKQEVRKIKTKEDHDTYIKKLDEKRNNPRLVGMGSCFSGLKNVLTGTYKDQNLDLSSERGYSLLGNSGWDTIVTIDDLSRNSVSIEDFIEYPIKLVNNNRTVSELVNIQAQLEYPKDLLKKIQKRINNPNPLIVF